MDPHQMKKRCPSSRFESVAILPNHELAFTLRSKRRRCGVANVLSCNDKNVFGVLYRINNFRDWRVLDAAEGFHPLHKRGNRYVRTTRKVKKLSGYPNYVIAFIYIGLIEKFPPPPNRTYLHQMIKGAKWHQFPHHYLQSLEKLKFI
jgi:hypothetical protein